MATRKHPRFGDRVLNTNAGEGNPLREAFFIRVVTTSGRLNKGTWYECTDGMGNVWQQSPGATKVLETRADREAAERERDEALAALRDARRAADRGNAAAWKAQTERDAAIAQRDEAQTALRTAATNANEWWKRARAAEAERDAAVARLQALRMDAQRLLRASEFHVARDERRRYRELHDAVVSMREALAVQEES